MSTPVTDTKNNYGVYSGASMIIDPKGRPIQQHLDDTFCLAELSLADLEIFRKKFPVLPLIENRWCLS